MTAWAAWAVAGLTLAAGLVLGTTPGVAGASHAKVVKVGTVNIPHVGVVLTNGAGLTLYYFVGDPAGKATCTGGCAKIYPPFSAPKGAHISGPKGVKGLSLINTGNSHWQVAFHHAALYRFEGDTKKGQDKAEGLLGKWFVAMKSGITPGSVPAGHAAAAAVPTTTPTTAPGAPGAPATTTTQAPHAATTTPMQQTPATSSPASPPPVPTTPPTSPPPPATTTPPTSPPTTTTTSGAGGGGVGF